MTAGGGRRALPHPTAGGGEKERDIPPHGGARSGKKTAPPGSSAGLILKQVQAHETEVYGAVLSLYVRFYAVQETAAHEEDDPHRAPSEHQSELLPGHAIRRRDVLVGVVGIEEQVDRVF